jgi:hypothetical protein
MDTGQQAGTKATYYIIRIAPAADQPASQYVICEKVISIQSNTPAFAFLESEFGGSSPTYEAADWDFLQFGVQMDGTIDP